jgi:hypothetical protein
MNAQEKKRQRRLEEERILANKKAEQRELEERRAKALKEQREQIAKKPTDDDPKDTIPLDEVFKVSEPEPTPEIEEDAYVDIDEVEDVVVHDENIPEKIEDVFADIFSDYSDLREEHLSKVLPEARFIRYTSVDPVNKEFGELTLYDKSFFEIDTEEVREFLETKAERVHTSQYYDDSTSSYQSSGGGIIQFATSLVGLGVMLIVGYMVFGQIGDVLNDSGMNISNEYGADSTSGEIHDIFNPVNILSSPFFFVILTLPMVFIFLNMITRAFG